MWAVNVALIVVPPRAGGGPSLVAGFSQSSGSCVGVGLVLCPPPCRPLSVLCVRRRFATCIAILPRSRTRTRCVYGARSVPCPSLAGAWGCVGAPAAKYLPPPLFFSLVFSLLVFPRWFSHLFVRSLARAPVAPLRSRWMHPCCACCIVGLGLA
jgi:hypothetical protein